jgi:hypothetical protein
LPDVQHAASGSRKGSRRPPPVSYVAVEHEPGVWVDAHVERQWKHEGRRWLAVYYFVDGLQYFRVFDTDQVRPAISAERREQEQGHATAGDEQSRGRHQRSDAVDLRHAQHVGRRTELP